MQAAKTCASALVFEAINRKFEIATERLNHTFRTLEDDERHELWEHATMATNVWIFMFAGDDLYGDVQQGIGYVMDY